MNRLSRVFVPTGALALLFSEVLMVVACFLAVTFLILNVDPQVFLLAGNGLVRIALAAGSILFGLYFENLYTDVYLKSRVLLVQQISLVMGIALLIQGLLSYVNDGLRLPLRLMLPACALLVIALFAWRIVYSALVLRVVGPQRILIVGMCPLLEDMASHIATHPELGLQVVGYLDQGSGPAAPPEAGKLLGPVTSLQEAVARHKPDRIVVGFSDRRGQMPLADLLPLRYGGMAIDEASTAYEQLCGRVVLSELRPADLLLNSQFQPHAERLIYQTLGHWLVALALTILTAPLLLLAAILLTLSRRGPLLIRQECAGLGGKPFPLYSLRLAGDQAELNRVQRFVARWSLDTLPHLWNVLRAEICFVGPRAERREFAEVLSEQIPFYRQRSRVKPGLTGWAQINTSPEQAEDTLRRLEYDFYYIKHFSHGLDAYILMHAFRDVLLARNA
jgi:lipopolysaccharide/colanic/teichoic acid biosynthesis glycosyltransferase